MATLTKLQGQYLAYIHYYAKVHRRAPSEREIQLHFGTTPPSVHDMILRLEARGLLAREPGVARSLRVLLPADQIPPLE